MWFLILFLAACGLVMVYPMIVVVPALIAFSVWLLDVNVFLGLFSFLFFGLGIWGYANEQ